VGPDGQRPRERSAARQRPPAGLGRGPEKERGEEGMGRPGIGLAGRIRGKVKAGKEFVFLFQI
jgi:hypothetical protein